MPKILLVDDDVEMSELLAFKLRKSGHEVVRAEDGEAALVAAREQSPDLILLDQMMPLMTGLEVLGVLKEDEALEHIPVIMLTAKSMESDIVEALETGADDFIPKPLSVKELVARVNRALRQPQSAGAAPHRSRSARRRPA